MLRASGGRIRRSRVLAHGQPVLSLTTTGRRSGEPRTTVVAYLRDGNDYVIFGVNLGSEHDPGWCRNLDAHPQAHVVVDGRRLDVVARRARDDERERLWARQATRLPAVAQFAAISGREVPVFRLGPA